MKTLATVAEVRDNNLIALSNGIQAAADAVLEVSGNEISNSVGGQPVSIPYLQQAIAARLQAHLVPSTSGA